MAPKKKLTKKELDKKKKEEEERKHQEEEEARIKAEQGEKERIQREKIEAEERKKLEKQELKKRSVELEEFRSFVAIHEDKLIDDERHRRQKYSWERYLLCDGSPDPTIPHEINTYINLWREDDRNVTIETIMIEGCLCLRLIGELEALIQDYKNEDAFTKQINQYYATITELQVLLQEKIDRASLEMLSKAKMLVENETCNLEKTWLYEKMILCLWGNIAKSAKVTKFKFPDIWLTLLIPKSLTSLDVAFRILYTQYDHYSSSCKYYKLRPMLIENEIVSEVVVAADEVQIEETAVLNPVDSDGPFDIMNVMAELDVAGGDEVSEKEETVVEQEEEIDPPPEDRIPSPVTILYEDFDGGEDVINLRNYYPLGGLFQIDMVEMPPQPKVVKGWTMTQQVVPPKLTPFKYDMTSDRSLQKKQSSFEGSERVENDVSQTVNKLFVTGPVLFNWFFLETNPIGTPKERVRQSGPIRASIKLPENIILAEPPTLALWHATEKVWKSGNLTIIENKEDERNVIFEIFEYGIVGLFQDFHINMPFQSWSLRPYHAPSAVVQATVMPTNDEINAQAMLDVVSDKEEVNEKLDFNPDSKNQTLLIVNAAIFDVRLHICDNRVRILPDNEHPELNGLAGKWYSVPDLISTMRFAGINIFPREDSARYITITEKNVVAENMLYDQMALLSPSVAFSWSRWNSQNKSQESIIVLASEHLHAERPVNEDDWSVLSFTRKKIEKLKMMEYDEKFSTEKDDRIEFHSNLFHFYQDFGCDEGMVAVNNIDSHYYDTVRKLLKAIRPIAFT